jgi:hypothetical protein
LALWGRFEVIGGLRGILGWIINLSCPLGGRLLVLILILSAPRFPLRALLLRFGHVCGGTRGGGCAGRLRRTGVQNGYGVGPAAIVRVGERGIPGRGVRRVEDGGLVGGIFAGSGVGTWVG